MVTNHWTRISVDVTKQQILSLPIRILTVDSGTSNCHEFDDFQHQDII